METVEQRAEEVLQAAVAEGLWNGSSLPVPVEDVADSHFGLLVKDVDDLFQAPGAPARQDGQTLSGLLLPDAAEIWVNRSEAKEWPGRRRFTIGHEVGHWVLHRRFGDGLFCRRSALLEEQPEPIPPAEDEANAFAAALLMPAGLVRWAYKKTDGDFTVLCKMFGASGGAMGRRLHRVVPRK